jgi:hypothetical protein
MSFRDKPQMFWTRGPSFLIPWAPSRDWSRYEAPSCWRLPSRADEAFRFREAQALRYLKQAG